MTQYEEEQACGRDIRFLQKDVGVQTPEDKQALAEVREGLTQDIPQEYLLENVRADGSYFWNKMSLWPVRASSMKVVRWIAVFKNVSATYKEHIMKKPVIQILAGSKAWVRAIREMRDDIGAAFGVAEPVRGTGKEFPLFKSLYRWGEPVEPMKCLDRLGATFCDTALRAEPCKTLATCTAGPEGCRLIEVPRAMWRAAHAMEAVKALNNLPHFSQLPTAILQKVAADMSLRRVPYRGFVAKEGDRAEHLFLVKSGQVKTEKIEYLEELPEANNPRSATLTLNIILVPIIRPSWRSGRLPRCCHSTRGESLESGNVR